MKVPPSRARTLLLIRGMSFGPLPDYNNNSNNDSRLIHRHAWFHIRALARDLITTCARFALSHRSPLQFIRATRRRQSGIT
eukprot:4020234-Pyramimonas_sp.AAC.1